MRQRKSIFRWLTGCLLVALLAGGILGGAGLSVRAATNTMPLALCPDPTVAQWTFTGNVTTPSSGSGIFSNGSGISVPAYVSGETGSENPAISFTGWDSASLDGNDFLEFRIDTSGKISISLDFKARVSSQGPTQLAIQYSTDGTSFTTFGSVVKLANDASWHSLNFNFSSIVALNNNPNAIIRLFGYAASDPAGTWILDNIRFSGVCPTSTILISEVAWAGTAANTDHEWIELYNPGAAPVDIKGWSLQAVDGNPNIPLNGTIPAGGYFLLERNEDAVANIMADQLYDFSNTLSNSGETLILYDAASNVIDTANSNGGAWPGGSTTNYRTMERIDTLTDSDASWFTNNGVFKNGIDADGNPLWGTPKNINSLTPTPVPPPTSTPVPIAPLSVVINEVAWAGTIASSDDEWMELYNPGTKDIDLTGWSLRSSDGTPDISTEFDGITIDAGGYLLLEREDNDVTNVDADVLYTGSLSNTGEILRLYDPNGHIVDTANSNGGAWPAGIASTYSSMQRSLIATDSDFVWVSYDVTKDTQTKAKDAAGNDIYGTPRRANTPINVTPTPTPKTSTGGTGGSSSGSTSGGTTIVPLLAISEFLPRPGYDWNNDGKVDVFDEFIEVVNAGKIAVNLAGYRLDDVGSTGSPPYTLPNQTLQPGEHAVFFASESGIHLSDAGDTVRLLRGSTVEDAYTYGVVRYPDQSWCRIPDRLGYWFDPCFPTPNNNNSLTGTIPLPPSSGYQVPICLLPDTTPEDFVYGECEAGGEGIWNRQYWDEADDAKRLKLGEDQKWETVFE